MSQRLKQPGARRSRKNFKPKRWLPAPSELRLIFSPLQRKKRPSLFGRHRDSRQRRGVRQNRIAFGGEVRSRGKPDFIRNYADVLQALAVAHDDVSVGDAHAVKAERTN